MNKTSWRGQKHFKTSPETYKPRKPNPAEDIYTHYTKEGFGRGRLAR